MKNFDELVKELEQKQNDLNKVKEYLNEEGKKLLDALIDINFNMSFLSNFEEIITDQSTMEIIDNNNNLKYINGLKRFLIKATTKKEVKEVVKKIVVKQKEEAPKLIKNNMKDFYKEVARKFYEDEPIKISVKCWVHDGYKYPEVSIYAEQDGQEPIDFTVKEIEKEDEKLAKQEIKKVVRALKAKYKDYDIEFNYKLELTYI